MRVYINGKEKILKSGLVKDNFTNNQVVIIDGFAVDESYVLSQDQKIILINKTQLPSQDLLESMIIARNGVGFQSLLKYSCIGIIGLGGLGSNIAVMLARAGVGNLVLIDFDTVEPSNLNRQHYFVNNLGQYKTQAMKEIIANINPYVNVLCINKKVDENNIIQLIRDCSIVCEAVDKADCKALIVNQILENSRDKIVIASSGMAGVFSSNSIKTHKKMARLYVCGDLKSNAELGCGLLSPRVNICAGHQANMVLRILLEKLEV